jgi:hypothetical protein
MTLKGRRFWSAAQSTAFDSILPRQVSERIVTHPELALIREIRVICLHSWLIPRLGVSLQLHRQLFSQFGCFVDRAFGFGTLRRTVPKGNGTHVDLFTNDFCVRCNGTLATATHAVEEYALRGYALKRVEVVQSFANLRNAFVIRPNLNANGTLSYTWQHHVHIKNCGQ